MTYTLKEHLADWTEFDVAGLHLGRCLGVFGSENESVIDIKHVFWSAHPVGESLVRFLDQLVVNGVLEHDAEHLRYRWSSSFRGSWQT